MFSDMRVLKLVEDPQAPGVLFAGIKIRKTYSVPVIPIQSILQSESPEVVRIGMHRGFAAWFRRLLLRMLILVLGFEYPIVPELITIAYRCRIGRSFVRCEDVHFKFAKRTLRIILNPWLKVPNLEPQYLGT